ncbi:AI-2E family transporter [Halorubrum sp. SD683]|uniref:AI-2E family transporter n=1 Tax=Halorubrum sp. SD683 TaxID=1855873 RepID=UPI0018E92FDC|nr:AI-2E family transporter [Halorubrum sp. SD683]
MNPRKGFLLTLVAVLLTLSGVLIQPFLQYVLGAVLLAYLLYPLQLRFEAHASSMVTAFSLVVLAVVGFVAPLVVVLGAVADSAERVLQDVETNGIPIEEIESRIEELTGQQIDILGGLAGSGREVGAVVFDMSIDAFGTVTFHLIGVALALFLLYYLLKDGDELLNWLTRMIPLPTDIQRELHTEINGVMWGGLFAHVFVALVQGVVAGIGLAVAGVPSAVFWTAVMIVLAMVPLVGTIPIWGGAVGYLYLTGEPAVAAGLFVYSVIIVGLTDDYLRPFAVNRYAKLNPAVILLGILGGGYAFGVMGLFFGPVVLGALKATLRVSSENWSRLDGGETG